MNCCLDFASKAILMWQTFDIVGRGLSIKARVVRSIVLVLLVIGLIVTSLAVTYISLGSGLTSEETDTILPQSLSVSIIPSGPVQLTTQQTQVFIANLSNTDSSLNYTWSIENSHQRSAINGTHYVLLTHYNQAVFKFLGSTVDFCWLNVEVNSTIAIACRATVIIQYITPPVEAKNQQKASEQLNQQTLTLTQTPIPTQTPTPSQTLIPSQPPTQNTNNYQNENSSIFINSTSNAKFIIQPTVQGYYQVIKGIEGNIVTEYSSNNANTTLNSAISGGGIIAIMSGDYSGAQLIVPPNANIIAEPDVTGIMYASIAIGARINEPSFNAAFGGYQAGDYTVTTNATSSATTKTFTLAFKPDNTVRFASTNASYVLNKLASIGGSIFVKGNLTLTSSIILSRSDTSLYSDGSTGLLYFCGVNGLNITGSGIKVSNLDIRQGGYERTKIGITCSGTYDKTIGYETLDNLNVWGWDTALSMIYTSSSQVSNIDTTFSFTGLKIQGQSVNNIFSDCLFSNFAKNQTTVLIQRDESLDIYPEGNIISHSLIYGGNIAVNLRYAFACQISDSIIDGWTDKGVKILGGQDTALSNNWIGCLPSSINSIAVEVSSDSSKISGNNLFAFNWTIYLHSSSNFLIKDNNFKGSAIADIYSIDNNGGSFANNNFGASSQAGILMQNSDGLSVYSNTFTGKGTAINMIASEHNSMVSNILNGTLQNGIILDGSSYNTFTGNSIYNSGQLKNNSYSDIWLVNNSTYNNVCVNIIVATGINNTAWGVLEGSLTDDYNMYSGNTVMGQVTGAIGIKGVHSLRGVNNPTSG
jgi:parallel beta-helix repeat protein